MHGMNIAVLYRETAASDKRLKQKLSQIAATNQVIIAPFNINALDASARATFIEQFTKVGYTQKALR